MQLRFVAVLVLSSMAFINAAPYGIFDLRTYTQVPDSADLNYQGPNMAESPPKIESADGVDVTRVGSGY